MTTIVIFKSNDSYKGFTCMGHAGFGCSGKDIVCASISVLVINTLNSIEELAKEHIVTESNEKEGYIECHFPDDINDKTKLLMDSMVMGLKEIEQNYGTRKKKKFFELIIKEV
ncbi:MAG: ribosomal-processing cysteine protease Prp [Lachnospiraceae bacterium]|nr:ribosomal-processing cysteine protease Prp [Lachnospiraceae bacterium]MBO5145138.1 ribosomal-processing cysteine protease Prp [Lachnospiraceae bacterium]